MLGIALVWIFMGVASYSIYSMWTLAAASNAWGLVYAGVIGGFVTLVIDGYSHISDILNRCIAITANYGEWTFMIGFVAFLLVMVYNGVTTSGQTLIR